MNESTVTTIAKLVRPIRRRLMPRDFKETFVNKTLAALDGPTLYLEIGVFEGESFRMVKADRKVGIDPVRREPMESLRPSEEFFEMTSDEFFAQQARRVLEPQSVDVALVDGEHEFAQVLTDILNAAPFMKPGGVVFLDDCNPRSKKSADARGTARKWHGDVWKIGAFIQGEWPGVFFTTLDADNGVGVVMGLSGSLPPPDPAVVSAYKDLGYAYLDANRSRVLNLVKPAAFAAD